MIDKPVSSLDSNKLAENEHMNEILSQTASSQQWNDFFITDVVNRQNNEHTPTEPTSNTYVIDAQIRSARATQYITTDDEVFFEYSDAVDHQKKRNLMAYCVEQKLDFLGGVEDQQLENLKLMIDWIYENKQKIGKLVY